MEWNAILRGDYGWKKFCSSRVFNAEKKIYSCKENGYKECSVQHCNKEKVLLGDSMIENSSNYIGSGCSKDLKKALDEINKGIYMTKKQIESFNKFTTWIDILQKLISIFYFITLVTFSCVFIFDLNIYRVVPSFILFIVSFFACFACLIAADRLLEKCI